MSLAQMCSRSWWTTSVLNMWGMSTPTTWLPQPRSFIPRHRIKRESCIAASK
ncbi:hypothetical protein ACHAWF_007828 [Thalassiosira exigua]